MYRLMNTHLSIRALSANVSLSPRRLAHLFRVELGVPPRQYLKALRMDRAQSLLHTSFLSVKEITFQSGFTNVSHFVRDFKKLHGATPSEFRSKVDQSPRGTNATFEEPNTLTKGRSR